MPNMTPVDPKGISAAGRVSLYFVPAIADPKAPKLTEIQAGFNLSMVVYKWDPKPKQDVQERWKYGSRTGGSTLGSLKYDVDAIEYDYDPQISPATGDYAHVDAMLEGTRGYMIDRRGLSPETAPAAGQFVDVFPVILGAQTTVSVDPKASGETLRIQQSIAIAGDAALRVKITA